MGTFPTKVGHVGKRAGRSRAFPDALITARIASGMNAASEKAVLKGYFEHELGVLKEVVIFMNVLFQVLSDILIFKKINSTKKKKNPPERITNVGYFHLAAQNPFSMFIMQNSLSFI